MGSRQLLHNLRERLERAVVEEPEDRLPHGAIRAFQLPRYLAYGNGRRLAQRISVHARADDNGLGARSGRYGC